MTPYLVNDLFDEYVKELLETNLNVSVSWWLICSFAYYRLDTSLISDGLFDYINNLISDNYSSIEHVNKDLVTPERLSVGSGYDIVNFPQRVQSATYRLIDLTNSPKSIGSIN